MDWEYPSQITTMSNDINKLVVQTAQDFETEYQSVDNVDPLEVKVECSLDGTVRNITLVMTAGGPHIEVNVTSGTVKGYWGSEQHTAPIMQNEQFCDELHEHYKMLFNQ